MIQGQLDLKDHEDQQDRKAIVALWALPICNLLSLAIPQKEPHGFKLNRQQVIKLLVYIRIKADGNKKYASATLSVESLEAISANLGDITAGSIAGVSIKESGIYSDYDRANVSGATVWTKGTLSMSDGKFRNDFKGIHEVKRAVSRNGFSEFIHEALSPWRSFNGTQTTTADRYLQITPFRINMIDSQGRGGEPNFSRFI